MTNTLRLVDPPRSMTPMPVSGMTSVGMISKVWPGAKAGSGSKENAKAATRAPRKATPAKDVEVVQHVEKEPEPKDEVKGVCPWPRNIGPAWPRGGQGGPAPVVSPPPPRVEGQTACGLGGPGVDR